MPVRVSWATVWTQIIILAIEIVFIVINNNFTFIYTLIYIYNCFKIDQAAIELDNTKNDYVLEGKTIILIVFSK